MDNYNTSAITLCGAGTMGTGIALLAATAGYCVRLYDSNREALNRSLESLNITLKQLEDKGKLSGQEPVAVRERVIPAFSLRDCRAGFCLEAIGEDLESKASLFCRLMELNGPGAVYATNTSSISVTTMAKLTPFPGRLAGMHFFNPAPVMKLVEVVHTAFTDQDVLQRIIALAEEMKKTPVQSSDSPGFIVNRVARPFYLESFLLAEQQEADFITIDRLMKSSGFPMGPFALSDLIGQDINLEVSRSLYAASGNAPRFRPADIQVQKVRAGELGRKTGTGFYTYPPKGPQSPG